MSQSRIGPIEQAILRTNAERTDFVDLKNRSTPVATDEVALNAHRLFNALNSNIAGEASSKIRSNKNNSQDLYDVIRQSLTALSNLNDGTLSSSEEAQINPILNSSMADLVDSINTILDNNLQKTPENRSEIYKSLDTISGIFEQISQQLSGSHKEDFEAISHLVMQLENLTGSGSTKSKYEFEQLGFQTIYDEIDRSSSLLTKNARILESTKNLYTSLIGKNIFNDSVRTIFSQLNQFRDNNEELNKFMLTRDYSQSSFDELKGTNDFIANLAEEINRFAVTTFSTKDDLANLVLSSSINLFSEIGQIAASTAESLNIYIQNVLVNTSLSDNQKRELLETVQQQIENIDTTSANLAHQVHEVVIKRLDDIEKEADAHNSTFLNQMANGRRLGQNIESSIQQAGNSATKLWQSIATNEYVRDTDWNPLHRLYRSARPNTQLKKIQREASKISQLQFEYQQGDSNIKQLSKEADQAAAKGDEVTAKRIQKQIKLQAESLALLITQINKASATIGQEWNKLANDDKARLDLNSNELSSKINEILRNARSASRDFLALKAAYNIKADVGELDSLKDVNSAIKELDKEAKEAGNRSEQSKGNLFGFFESVMNGVSGVFNSIKNALTTVGLGDFVLGPISLAAKANEYHIEQSRERYRSMGAAALIGAEDLNIEAARAQSRMMMGNELFLRSGGRIDQYAVQKSYQSLIQIGGQVGATPEQTTSDMDLLARNTALIQNVYGLDQSTVNNVVATYYRDMRMSASEASSAFYRLVQTAQSANVPIDQYLQSINELSKRYMSVGIAGHKAESVLDNLMNQHIRIDIAKEVASQLAESASRFSENENAVGFAAVMQGENPFDAFAKMARTHDSKGDPRDEWVTEVTSYMDTYLKYTTMPYGDDSDMKYWGLVRTLKSQFGLNQQTASMLASAAEKHGTSSNMFKNLFKDALNKAESPNAELEKKNQQVSDQLAKMAAQLSSIDHMEAKSKSMLFEMASTIGGLIDELTRGIAPILIALQQTMINVVVKVVTTISELVDSDLFQEAKERILGALKWLPIALTAFFAFFFGKKILGLVFGLLGGAKNLIVSLFKAVKKYGPKALRFAKGLPKNPLTYGAMFALANAMPFLSSFSDDDIEKMAEGGEGPSFLDSLTGMISEKPWKERKKYDPNRPDDHPAMEENAETFKQLDRILAGDFSSVSSPEDQQELLENLSQIRQNLWDESKGEQRPEQLEKIEQAMAVLNKELQQTPSGQQYSLNNQQPTTNRSIFEQLQENIPFYNSWNQTAGIIPDVPTNIEEPPKQVENIAGGQPINTSPPLAVSNNNTSPVNSSNQEPSTQNVPNKPSASNVPQRVTLAQHDAADVMQRINPHIAAQFNNGRLPIQSVPASIVLGTQYIVPNNQLGLLSAIYNSQYARNIALASRQQQLQQLSTEVLDNKPVNVINETNQYTFNESNTINVINEVNQSNELSRISNVDQLHTNNVNYSNNISSDKLNRYNFYSNNTNYFTDISYDNQYQFNTRNIRQINQINQLQQTSQLNNLTEQRTFNFNQFADYSSNITNINNRSTLASLSRTDLRDNEIIYGADELPILAQITTDRSRTLRQELSELYIQKRHLQRRLQEESNYKILLEEQKSSLQETLNNTRLNEEQRNIITEQLENVDLDLNETETITQQLLQAEQNNYNAIASKQAELESSIKNDLTEQTNHTQEQQKTDTADTQQSADSAGKTSEDQINKADTNRQEAHDDSSGKSQQIITDHNDKQTQKTSSIIDTIAQVLGSIASANTDEDKPNKSEDEQNETSDQEKVEQARMQKIAQAEVGRMVSGKQNTARLANGDQLQVVSRNNGLGTPVILNRTATDKGTENIRAKIRRMNEQISGPRSHWNTIGAPVIQTVSGSMQTGYGQTIMSDDPEAWKKYQEQNAKRINDALQQAAANATEKGRKVTWNLTGTAYNALPGAANTGYNNVRVTDDFKLPSIEKISKAVSTSHQKGTWTVSGVTINVVPDATNTGYGPGVAAPGSNLPTLNAVVNELTSSYETAYKHTQDNMQAHGPFYRSASLGNVDVEADHKRNEELIANGRYLIDTYSAELDKMNERMEQHGPFYRSTSLGNPEDIQEANRPAREIIENIAESYSEYRDEVNERYDSKKRDEMLQQFDETGDFDDHSVAESNVIVDSVVEAVMEHPDIDWHAERQYTVSDLINIYTGYGNGAIMTDEEKERRRKQREAEEEERKRKAAASQFDKDKAIKDVEQGGMSWRYGGGQNTNKTFAEIRYGKQGGQQVVQAMQDGAERKRAEQERLAAEQRAREETYWKSVKQWSDAEAAKSAQDWKALTNMAMPISEENQINGMFDDNKWNSDTALEQLDSVNSAPASREGMGKRISSNVNLEQVNEHRLSQTRNTLLKNLIQRHTLLMQAFQKTVTYEHGNIWRQLQIEQDILADIIKTTAMGFSFITEAAGMRGGGSGSLATIANGGSSNNAGLIIQGGQEVKGVRMTVYNPDNDDPNGEGTLSTSLQTDFYKHVAPNSQGAFLAGDFSIYPAGTIIEYERNGEKILAVVADQGGGFMGHADKLDIFRGSRHLSDNPIKEDWGTIENANIRIVGRVKGVQDDPSIIYNFANDRNNPTWWQQHVELANGVSIQAAPQANTNPLSSNIVTEARKYIGKPYVYGGDNPNTGADCSGLVQYVISQTSNIQLPHNAEEQRKWLAEHGTSVNMNQLQPGDILFFTRNGENGAHHTAIYSGNGQMIDAKGKNYGIMEGPVGHSSEKIEAYRLPPTQTNSGARNVAYFSTNLYDNNDQRHYLEKFNLSPYTMSPAYTFPIINDNSNMGGVNSYRLNPDDPAVQELIKKGVLVPMNRDTNTLERRTEFSDEERNIWNQAYNELYTTYEQQFNKQLIQLLEKNNILVNEETNLQEFFKEQNILTDQYNKLEQQYKNEITLLTNQLVGYNPETPNGINSFKQLGEALAQYQDVPGIVDTDQYNVENTNIRPSEMFQDIPEQETLNNLIRQGDINLNWLNGINLSKLQEQVINSHTSNLGTVTSGQNLFNQPPSLSFNTPYGTANLMHWNIPGQTNVNNVRQVSLRDVKSDTPPPANPHSSNNQPRPLSSLPDYKQAAAGGDAGTMCGNGGAATFISAITGQAVTPGQLLAKYGTMTDGGASVSKALNDYGIEYQEINLPNDSSGLEAVKNAIAQGIPVLYGTNAGASTPWMSTTNGHYMVIYGMNKQGQLYVANPGRNQPIQLEGNINDLAKYSAGAWIPTKYNGQTVTNVLPQQTLSQNGSPSNVANLSGGGSWNDQRVRDRANIIAGLASGQSLNDISGSYYRTRGIDASILNGYQANGQLNPTQSPTSPANADQPTSPDNGEQADDQDKLAKELAQQKEEQRKKNREADLSPSSFAYQQQDINQVRKENPDWTIDQVYDELDKLPIYNKDDAELLHYYGIQTPEINDQNKQHVTSLNKRIATNIRKGLAPNGRMISQNDLQYLLGQGYSEEAAKAALFAHEKYKFDPSRNIGNLIDIYHYDARYDGRSATMVMRSRHANDVFLNMADPYKAGLIKKSEDLDNVIQHNANQQEQKALDNMRNNTLNKQLAVQNEALRRLSALHQRSATKAEEDKEKQQNQNSQNKQSQVDKDSTQIDLTLNVLAQVDEEAQKILADALQAAYRDGKLTQEERKEIRDIVANITQDQELADLFANKLQDQLKDARDVAQ